MQCSWKRELRLLGQIGDMSSFPCSNTEMKYEIWNKRLKDVALLKNKRISLYTKEGTEARNAEWDPKAGTLRTGRHS